MEKLRDNLRKLTKTCFEGELTMPKVNFWLAGAVCLLAGMVYGLLAAPMTHGLNIACSSGNTNNSCKDKEDEEE